MPFLEDPDFTAYKARVSANSGTLSAAEETAVEGLIADLKNGSYWDSCTNLFLFIGSDHNAAKTYLIGGQDIANAGTVNLFDGSHYTREAGFYKEAGSAYEAKLNLGSNSSFNWGGSGTITSYFWGRNSQNGARQGFHPVSTGGDSWSVPSYHEGSYSGGWQLKAPLDAGGTNENGWGGSTVDTMSFQSCAYNGSTGFTGRSMNQSDTKSGATLTLSGTISNTTSNWYLHADNPVLGCALWDGVEHTSTQMDAINEIFHDFVTACGVTMGAHDPDTD